MAQALRHREHDQRDEHPRPEHEALAVHDHQRQADERFGALAQVLYDYTGRARRRWLALFPYSRTVAGCAFSFLLGIALTVPLIVDYVSEGLSLPTNPGPVHHLAVTGLLAMIVGFTTFAFTLILHAAALSERLRRDV